MLKCVSIYLERFKNNPEIADLLNESEKSNKFMPDWDIYKSIDRNI